MDISSEAVDGDLKDNADRLSPIHSVDADEDAEMSVMETLRSLQEDNPQVETIFIESDEEEDEIIHQPSIQIHEVHSVTPPHNILPNYSTNSQTRIFNQTLAIKAPNNSSSSQSNNLNQMSTFMVREIAPSMLTQNIVSNANTIALFNESTASSASRSYLVIPQDIIPILARSKGPVSLNVPGIGPLVIPKPSDMLLLQKNKTQVSATSVAEKIPEKSTGNSVYHRPYDPLNDPKHRCWTYRRALKRDLDGYTLNDRLGFNKSEQKRSKLCVYTCNEVVKKLEYSIHMLKRELSKTNDSKLNTNRFRFIDIDKIKGKRRGRPRKQQKNKVNPPELSAIQKKNLQTLLSWKERFGRSNENNLNDDLLVTKKVVIVNKKRRGRKKKQSYMNFKSSSEDEGGRLSSTDEYTDSKFNNQIDKKTEENLPETIEFVDVNKSITPVKRKRGRPKKLKTIKQEQLHYQQLFNIKPCSVEISPMKLGKETLDKFKNYYTHELITTSKEFCEKIDSSKPILVLNEKQCAKLNLAELQEKNNLVFPTKEMCFSDSFSEEAKAYNIKFVKPDILCTYLTAGESN